MLAKSFWQLQANALQRTLRERINFATLANIATWARNRIQQLSSLRQPLRQALNSFRQTTTSLGTTLGDSYRRYHPARFRTQTIPSNATPKIQLSIYIAATPEKVWQALTDPNLIEQYWSGARVESDWQVGSTVYYWRHGRIIHEQVVSRAEPCAFLQYSFHLVSAERLPRELPSRVSFSIAAMDRMVRLTLVHDEFHGESAYYQSYQEFWPMLLSNLKTLLETGKPLFTY